MRVLALDTTTSAGSVALVDDESVIAERVGDSSRTHAARLPDEVFALLDSCGARLEDVDVFAVARGPGSFTGLRIGIATIQGLAFVTRRPVVGISALDALAHAAGAALERGATIAAWMDAHRREVFSALYRVGEGDPFAPLRLAPVEEASVGDPVSTIERWATRAMLPRDQPPTFAGDGAVLYGAVVREYRPGAIVMNPDALAGTIGRMARVLAAGGDPTEEAGVRPLYVRRPDAELAREKKDVSYEEQRQR